MKIFLVMLFASICTISVSAQEQLFVPECVSCPQFTTPPYPHSGLWSNPFESGTGINVDVQNGIVAANFYAYKEDGSPIWYQFSGELQQSENPNIYWTLTNDLYTFSGGQVLGGEHAHPEHEVVGTITVDFLRRNLLRFQVDDGPVRTMSPFMFGAGSEQYFEPESNLFSPSFTEGNRLTEMREAPWIIVQKDADGHTGKHDYAQIFWRLHWGATGSRPGTGKHSFGIDFWDYDAPLHVVNTGVVSCGSSEQMTEIYYVYAHWMSAEEHFCLMSVAGNQISEGRMYYIRIGDITDRRFVGVSEDGWVVEGFRLLYD